MKDIVFLYLTQLNIEGIFLLFNVVIPVYKDKRKHFQIQCINKLRNTLEPGLIEYNKNLILELYYILIDATNIAGINNQLGLCEIGCTIQSMIANSFKTYK